MTLPSCASLNHAEAGKKRACVCSSPPSVVGTGMLISGSVSSSVLPGVDDEPQPVALKYEDAYQVLDSICASLTLQL